MKLSGGMEGAGTELVAAYVKRILASRVYDIASESPLQLAARQ